MYNKNQFKKVNNKKILHKVKKQWVTISLALLMMIGGGAVATHVSANADTNANAKPQVTSNAPQSNSASSITDQAKALHNNMLRNAGLSQAKPATLGATKVGSTQSTNAPKVVKTAKWDNANVNYYNNDVMELTGNGSINSKDVPTLPLKTSDGYTYQSYDWSLKIDKSNAHILMNNSSDGGEFSANYNPIWKYFNSMDLSGLDTSHVTNMNNMFENDSNLSSLDLSNLNTSNATQMNYMFNGVHLNSLNLSSFDTRKATMNNFMPNVPNVLVLGPTTELKSGAVNVHKLTASDFVDHNFEGVDNSDVSHSAIVTRNNSGSDSMDGTYPSDYHAKNSKPYLNTTNNSYVINSNDNGIAMLMDKNGNNVDEQLQNGTILPGTYYRTHPIRLALVNQNGDMFTTPYYIQIPYYRNPNLNYMTYKDNNEHTVNEGMYSGFNYEPLIKDQVQTYLNNHIFLNNDYTVNQSQDYVPKVQFSNMATEDDFPSWMYLPVNVTTNNQKIISDATNVINNDLSTAKTYTFNNISYDINNIQSDVNKAQHDQTEPHDANTIDDIVNAEHDADKNLKDITDDQARMGHIKWNRSAISNLMNRVDHIASDNNVKTDPEAQAIVNASKYTIQQALNDVNNDYANPTMANVNKALQDARTTDTAIGKAMEAQGKADYDANNHKFNPSQPSNLTPQPANTTDQSMVKGIHEYLSNDGKTLTVTGDMGNYAKFVADQGNNMDYSLHNNIFNHVTTLNLGNATNLTNGIGLFSRMPSLKTIRQVGNWDTSHLTDMSAMFAEDRSLSDITPLAHWNTSHVTTMNNVLSDTNVSDLSPIANWDTSNVKDMSEAFEFDNNLKTLAPLAHWNTGNNTTMFGMFLMDKNLSNVSAVANWNINNVKDMTEAFSGDSKLSDLTPFTNWNTRNINNMSDMFSSDNISNLSPLTNWNTSNVTTMSDMFDGNNITDLTPLTNWKTFNVSSMFRLFQDNPKLSNISPLSHWNTDAVNNMGQMFYGDPLLVNKTPIQNWHINNIGDVNPLPNDAAKANSASSSSNTSSATSASSSANSSASSQSSNQSSEASQSSSSNVAPSSAQQPSDNNADNTPFVPSVNVPTTPSTPVAPVNPTPVVTPTQNNTTSMSDNNNSSVEPQTTNTTVNANTNSQVSDSTKPTVNKHHNARVARNHHARRESIYLFNTDFKGLSKRNRSVVTIKGVRAYKRTRKGHYVPVKNIKPNTKLAVKRVIKFGKITKLQLTNGWLVTSNKHFVSVKKFAKRANKRAAKRAIKGIDSSRYTRALRKSNYVLRHGRRHATRYTYRIAKKFNRANNSEKKAYRKFARKYTNRNRKLVNKAITNLNKLVNALLK